MNSFEERTGRFLHSLPFFAALPDADVDNFLSGATIRPYAKNETLFMQGDRADRFFIVISGWIKIYRVTPEGEEAITAIFTRGDVFGEAAVFGGALYPSSAQAVEEARIAEIPSDFLRERARENQEIMARLMASMSREIHNLELEHEHIALMNASQRVGCLLLQFSADINGKGGAFTFPYDKSLAASRLGMKPETFSRALAQLKGVGVTVKGPEVRIADFEKLIHFCCSHCSAQPDECGGRHGIACCGSGACPKKGQAAAKT